MYEKQDQLNGLQTDFSNGVFRGHGIGVRDARRGEDGTCTRCPEDVTRESARKRSTGTRWGRERLEPVR